MKNSRRDWRGFLALSALLALSGCGGGSASNFAQAVGVAPVPAPTATPEAPVAAVPTYPSYFVDFDNGNDNSDGKTKATAWKHAPGDPEARGVAGSAVLKPGDHLVFAANVRYRGAITAEWSGTAAQPIVIEGAGTTPTAVIDGTSHTATLQPCASQAACNGVAAWKSVHIASFPTALPTGAQMFAGGRMLMPAQWPDPKDLFYSDETADMASEAGANLNAGRAAVPAAAAEALAAGAGDTRVAVWVQSNRIEERAVSAVKANTVQFDASGISSYTDRPASFALRGHSGLISKAGEFAILPDRKTVLVMLPAAATTISASTGRGGIDLSGANHVVVRNLAFENMSDIEGNVRTGMPLWAMRKPAGNITIEGNRFANLYMTNQQGAVTMWKTTNLLVKDNSFNTIVEGSAVRVLNSANATVRENVVERISGTALTFMTNTDSLMALNQVRDAKGVHGNGISIYLGNQRTRVIANTVTESKRPMTIKGNGTATPAADDLLIANNLLVATGDSVGSLMSWGDVGNRIRIHNNVILGAEKGALKLHAADRNVTIQRNVIAGMSFAEVYPSDWSVSANSFTRLGPFQLKLAPLELVASALSAPVTADGAMPANLAQFCPYITEILDYAALGTGYGRSVGATHSCR